MRGDLNDKQVRFCQEYLADLNGKQAAIRAGYSPKTAEVQASKLLSLPKVAAFVKTLMDERGQRTQVTVDSVVASIEACRDGAFAEGAWAPAIRANELLGKHVGMFSQQLAVEGGLAITVKFEDADEAD